ncbi:unnamed protein product [Brugia timori]|uniref:Uncharacterized protein n=1 Tax=Brugia timori TaxID=42155 RepID=A0A3P7TNK4_9BILA|nr:unnamed protein product [Brugia timori]
MYIAGNVDQWCCPLFNVLGSLLAIGLLRNTACRRFNSSVVVLTEGKAVFTDDRILGTTGAVEEQHDCCAQKPDIVL